MTIIKNNSLRLYKYYLYQFIKNNYVFILKINILLGQCKCNSPFFPLFLPCCFLFYITKMAVNNSTRVDNLFYYYFKALLI